MYNKARNDSDEEIPIQYNPQDNVDYALALTLTSMHNHTTATSDTSNEASYDYSVPPIAARADTRLLNNVQSVLSQDHHLLRTRTHTPDTPGGYTSSPRNSMEILSYSNSNGASMGRSNPFLTARYQGIGSHISTNYATDLGILNAESYDDGRHPVTAQGTTNMRIKHQVQLPFGVTEHPTIRLDEEPRTESDDHDRGTKRPRKHKLNDPQVADEEEEARKKARGRPRVDTKDETAADRRRTQIRMAQRAYRHRKETTITSLEKQVQELRGTNEEMSNIFISLYDFAVGKGLLQREPEFGQQLQSTTERFLALAKATNNEDGSFEESQVEESVKRSEPESASMKKDARAPPKKKQEPARRESESTVQPWGGYTVTKDDRPTEELPMEFQPQVDERKTRGGDVQIITRPTEENASFPFNFMDIQQYRVEVPSVEDFSRSFLPASQPPMPTTHAYSEFSFARRIHRGALEKAVTLLSLVHPPKQRFQEVFGFSLMYMSKEDLLANFKALLAGSTKDTLHGWRMPFVHTGGAGTFYPMYDSELNSGLMPKFRTGFSMGPFSPRVSEVQDSLLDDLRCTIPGYGGDFFDPNDVEGYLRGRGLDIPPAADFVTAEIDFSELMSPKSIQSSESAFSSLSPQTPTSPGERVTLENSIYANNFDFNKLDIKAFPFPIGYADWENNDTVKEGSNVQPIFNTIPAQNFNQVVEGAKRASVVSEPSFGDRRLVTINVKVLLEELLNRVVCLGRAPGFRPSDVNASIMAAIKAGF